MNDANPSQALQEIVAILDGLEPEARSRVLDALSSFFRSATNAPQGVDSVALGRVVGNTLSGLTPKFSEVSSLSPKEFMLRKQPSTDVERIACLAFYLTHYRDTPHFKTLDLAKLNTDAALPKFSNTAYATNNAISSGYLVPAPGGLKQLSAAGEQFVQLLPDRAAARASMLRIKGKRVAKNTKKRKR